MRLTVKKGTNKLLIAIVFVGVLCSCNKNLRDCNIQPYYELSPSVKQWFPYSGNKDLVFLDSTSKLDTLQLKNFFLGEDEVWNGDECPSSKGLFLRGIIVDTKSNDTIKTEIGYAERVLIERKSTWINYYDTKKIVSQPNTYRRFETTITLNGYVYNDVLATECSPADNCSGTGITKHYFAKGKGLVAFERNGIVWTLKE